MEIKVMDKVLAANDAWADENRKFLAERRIRMFNIIGSPGCGKTTLFERTIDLLRDEFNIGVIEGDIATTRDAERIQKKGVPVFQINTGAACHLDAHLVNAAIKAICDEGEINLIFVENIGNLVCPAEFDIGETAKIAMLSTPEGDDKIEKYPLLFSEAKAMIISKMGLMEFTNFDLTSVAKSFINLNRECPSFKLDSLTGEGFDSWLNFIRDEEFKK